MVKIIKAT